MSARVVDVKELKSLAGQELGVSDWHLVTQEEINQFAEATHDHQWIHVDPERAKKESPFGGPIAHGYYTLALAPYLVSQALTVTGARMGVNYGLNSLRFTAPVRIGKRVRVRVAANSVEAFTGGVQVAMGLTYEVEGESKPACVAEVVYRYYP
jgi:acyl dehydratase